MPAFPSSSIAQPSLVDWLEGILVTCGPQTLDQLAGRLPDTNWAQLLLAVDHLSRSGHLSIALVARGNYVVSLSRSGASHETALEEPRKEPAGITSF